MASLAFLAAGQVPPEMMLTNLPKVPLILLFQLFLGSLKDEPSSILASAPWKSGLLFPTSRHLWEDSLVQVPSGLLSVGGVNEVPFGRGPGYGGDWGQSQFPDSI